MVERTAGAVKYTVLVQIPREFGPGDDAFAFVVDGVHLPRRPPDPYSDHRSAGRSEVVAVRDARVGVSDLRRAIHRRLGPIPEWSAYADGSRLPERHHPSVDATVDRRSAGDLVRYREGTDREYQLRDEVAVDRPCSATTSPTTTSARKSPRDYDAGATASDTASSSAPSRQMTSTTSCPPSPT